MIYESMTDCKIWCCSIDWFKWDFIDIMVKSIYCFRLISGWFDWADNLSSIRWSSEWAFYWYMNEWLIVSYGDAPSIDQNDVWGSMMIASARMPDQSMDRQRAAITACRTYSPRNDVCFAVDRLTLKLINVEKAGSHVQDRVEKWCGRATNRFSMRFESNHTLAADIYFNGETLKLDVMLPLSPRALAVGQQQKFDLRRTQAAGYPG